jgi:hypothetical protein
MLGSGKASFSETTCHAKLGGPTHGNGSSGRKEAWTTPMRERAACNTSIPDRGKYLLITRTNGSKS